MTTPPEMGAGTEKRHSGRPAENNRPYAAGRVSHTVAGRVSHTVASRETVLTVSNQIGISRRLHFRDTLKPVKETNERIDVMNEVKSKNLFIRVSEKEKNLIERNAEKCGLSISEYLRQRALGYMPRTVLPEVFFSFSDKLDALCIACEGKISADTEEKMIALIDGITEELILPKREKAVV